MGKGQDFRALASLAILVLSVGGCLGGAASYPNDPSTVTEPSDQYGDLTCDTDDQGIMTAIFYMWKNNSAITRVYFSQEGPGTQMGIPLPNACCLWTGTGALNDPFTTQILVDTNNDVIVPGECDCGMQIVITQDTYKWVAYTQRVENMHMDGDREFGMTCNIDNGLVDIISTQWDDAPIPILNIPAVTNAAMDLELYDQTSSLTPLFTIDVGTDIHIRVTFNPPTFADLTNIDIDLIPWGMYCDELYVYPQPGMESRRVDLIDPNTGCPTSNSKLASGFFTAAQPASGATYRANTGAFEAWRFDEYIGDATDVPNTVFFTCVARLCWLPDDPNCLDRCTASAGKRKRRQTGEAYLHETYTIRTSIVIKPKDEPENTEAWTFQDVMVPIFSAVGVLILILVVVIAAVIFRRRRISKQKDKSYMDNSSFESTRQVFPGKY